MKVTYKIFCFLFRKFMNVNVNEQIIKAVFSNENLSTPNRSLLCHIDPSIISRKDMHNSGQILKLQSAVVHMNIRSRSLKSN